MWHLRTKSGIFWVIKAGEETAQSFLFGIDDCKLAVYQDLNRIAQDVFEQATGYLDWDCQSRVKVPSDISQWKQGPPEGW